MKKKFFIYLLLATLASPINVFAEPTAGVISEISKDFVVNDDLLYTTTKVNIRSEPSIYTGEILDTLMPNTPVEKKGGFATFDNDDDWTYVAVDETTCGFIKTQYLSMLPTPVEQLNRWNIALNNEEIDLLAKILWAESRGEPLNGQEAVVEVVFNRMITEEFPTDLYEVVSQCDNDLQQFNSWDYIDEATPNPEQYEAIYNVLFGTTNITGYDTYFFSTKPQTKKVEIIIGNHYFCKGE